MFLRLDFLPARLQRNKWALAVVRRPYVCMCLWLSVTGWYCVKTAEPIVKIFSPSGSPTSLVLMQVQKFFDHVHKKIRWGTKHKYLARFCQPLELNCEYLRNAWTYRKSETCVSTSDEYTTRWYKSWGHGPPQSPGVSVKDHSLPPKMRKWHILPICGQFSAVTPRMSEPIMSPFLFYNRLGAVTPKNLWGIKIFTFLHIVA